MFIPIRTTGGSPFYLLVPSYYLAILLFITALVVVYAFPARKSVLITQGTVMALIVAHVVGFRRPRRHI